MSSDKPISKTYLFDDTTIKTGEPCVAAVNCSAMKHVLFSNSVDLRDSKDHTVVTLTWPSQYKVRVI